MSANSLMKAPQPAEKNKPIKVCIVLYYIVLFYARWQCGVSYEYRMYQSGPSSVNTNLVRRRYGYGGSLLYGQNTVQIYIIQCIMQNVDTVSGSLLLVVASVLARLIGILTTHNIRPGLYTSHYVTALIFIDIHFPLPNLENMLTTLC